MQVLLSLVFFLVVWNSFVVAINKRETRKGMSGEKDATETHVTKTVYLIRHAESMENQRMASLKNIFGKIGRLSLPSGKDLTESLNLLNVPAQIDSNVSVEGQQQIDRLAAKLKTDDFLNTKNVRLVAHSPLKRARETCLGVLGCQAPTSDDSPATTPPTSPDVRVVELDTLAEKFPSEWLPGNFGSFQKRMDDFEEWIAQQPEDTMAIVGHSQYFKAMLTLDFKFGNCDVWELQYDASGGKDMKKKDNEEYKVPRGWSGLKRLYTVLQEE